MTKNDKKLTAEEIATTLTPVRRGVLLYGVARMAHSYARWSYGARVQDRDDNAAANIRFRGTALRTGPRRTEDVERSSGLPAAVKRQRRSIPRAGDGRCESVRWSCGCTVRREDL